jgi:hypothetical protein
MKSKKNVIFHLLAGLMLFGIFPWLSNASIGSFTQPEKLKLQEETIELLDRLDKLPGSNQNLNALFTDQTEENICKYVNLYNELIKLLQELDENLGKWNKIIAQDEYEKIYRLYAAAIQTAQYSVYSSHEKYLGFLKMFNNNKKYERLKCRNLTAKDELLNYEDSSEEWKIKAEEMLAHAKINIEKALELDHLYEDAKILQAQILALEGKYDKAKESFDIMGKKGFLKNKPSLLNSWRAYIELKKNNHSAALDFLIGAYTSPSPGINSNWARNYRKYLKNSKAKWIIQKPNLFEPVSNIDLEKLKNNSRNAINEIREALRNPLSLIPAQPTKSKLDQLAKQPTPQVIFTLDTDRSERNLNHYTEMLENLYDIGDRLMILIREWNKLAEKNKDTDYYFLINKSSCSLVLLHMVNATKSLIGDAALNKRLKTTKKDITKKWYEWEEQISDSLESDLKKALSQENDLIYIHILAFEYDALFSDPQKALTSLDNLSRELNGKQIEKIPLFSQAEIDTKAYIASWRVYLEFKRGDLKAVKKFMKEAKGFSGLSIWLEDQQKLIDLNSIPKKN